MTDLDPADWIANARSLTQSSSIPLGVPVNIHMLPLAWFTSNPDVPREALGLTSRALACDRTACRFAATNRRHLIPWRHYAAPHPIRRLLESAPGVDPALWWVSTRPVQVADA